MCRQASAQGCSGGDSKVGAQHTCTPRQHFLLLCCFFGLTDAYKGMTDLFSRCWRGWQADQIMLQRWSQATILGSMGAEMTRTSL